MIPTITFVCPTRNRDYMKCHYEYNIDQISKAHNYDYKIIYVEQCDNKKIMPNQLRNIGMLYADTEYIVYKDIDFIDIYDIDLINYYNTFKKPYRTYTKRQHLKYNESYNKFMLFENPHDVSGCGYAVFTKNDFENKNGLSISCIGWGYEDDLNMKRYDMPSVSRVLGHQWHPSNDSFGTIDTDLNAIAYNKWLNGQIDYNEDGYKQMVYNIIADDNNGKIRNIKVNNIGVTKNYKYMDIINKHPDNLIC